MIREKKFKLMVDDAEVTVVGDPQDDTAWSWEILHSDGTFCERGRAYREHSAKAQAYARYLHVICKKPFERTPRARWQKQETA